MDGTKLQAKIYKGYGQAAKRIGFDYQQFRATSASNPLSSTALQTLPASFTTNFSYSAPNKYGQATWLGLFDARTFTPGDFLVGRQGTFFIAAMQDTLPIYCVQTNRIVSVLRDQQDQSVGLGAYSGGTRATEAPLMQGWPASILQGTKGETNDAKLPLDVKTPWWAILMPAYPGIILRTSDIIRDELGRKYIISSAELTDMGWRITAMQAQV
ncbi:hypothetical protein [Pseudomonas costantinii]|uniref:Uncharacterized protein n=1 Tax=Pseudomonas costantinii TaxID=168469 RepID=A0A1S2UEP8_9PSED|nr:hypothetical protein [Pseudomonas costantinii]OIN44516.1 hypothetical protein BFL40_29965 [Pseudomonas costantinii]SED26528.1 hypothetical protein SAMN04515675_0485 [Pseudomonas costantinii]